MLSLSTRSLCSYKSFGFVSTTTLSEIIAVDNDKDQTILEEIILKLRNSTKAIIIENNSVLVTKLHDENEIFYLLPGGGQEPGEKLIDCLVRECIEETGYEIEVNELLFIRECFMDKDIHRVEFIFKGNIVRETEITGMDKDQLGIEWLELDNILNEPLFPTELRTLIKSYINGDHEKTYIGEIN